MIIDQLDTPLTGTSLKPTPAGVAYTDPEIFIREQAEIFEKMWNAVLRADSLASPGQWRTVTVGREEIIVVRTRKAGIKAYLNVCRHRGMRVCTTAEGRSKTLQCGYHAWTYALEGELVAAPNLTSMPDVDRGEHGLKTVHVREWLGYIWLCVSPAAGSSAPPSFEETVMTEVSTRFGEVQSLENYGIEKLRVGQTRRYEVAANWKLIIENFMECYHCATIHPELTEVIPEFAQGWASQAQDEIHGASFGAQVEGFTVDGSAGVAALPAIAEAQDRKYYAITVRPQVFINTVPDHVIFHRMYPVSAAKTIVECDWLFLPEVVEKQLDVSRSVELFHRVNLQDFEACEQTQPSMSSKAYDDGGALVPSEHHIAEFHQWWAQQIGPFARGR
ncbi:aromatic ring-hydroxylating dioxygenase subunit alpha [Nesterenkonia sp. LB17]|uniref:aromatic ring-hydroxylating oxygenase subunit alpha n=1 Tax=unclassified Nesterenkonia TaxID=2629769 RepID=UPI001F4D2297|nr:MULTISPECIES: aromatic ring-hydroxylating dioxygenase subunit alpha [unclassified Nesterenkonia]MCH8561456.1 aromatic ring-hydroxylating dioxygenase subunit alpha [Nesterenkonia sp. DZ6]MCH8566499.1 aromatic ring-hydroxylating dioxygenase subunit alpha [Nesterenkonia sp. LB17]